MPLQTLVEIIRSHREIAVCDSAVAKVSHRNLYQLPDGAYLDLSGQSDLFDAFSGLIEGCADDAQCVEFRMHVVLRWLPLLHVAAWKPQLDWPDIYLLLKDAGVAPADMKPFRDGNPEDLFPWLYYGKQLDVLRRICLRAKRKLDEFLSLHDVRVLCHLVMDDSQRIVASSL